jgi:hypothetical protein
MKKLWLLLVMVTPLQLIHAQEVKHAPTVEQCHADASSAPVDASSAPVSYKEMSSWISEMGQCMNVDIDNFEQYLHAQDALLNLQLERIQNFVRRHNQWNQFIAEDAHGKGR